MLAMPFAVIGFLIGHPLLVAQTPFWEPTSGPNGITVETMALNRTGEIIAGTESDLFATSDGGITWRRLDVEGANPIVNALVMTPSGTLVAGTDVGVYRSTDDGATWTAAGSIGGSPFVQGRREVTRLAVRSDGALFAGATEVLSLYSSIYLSTDDGATWMEIADGLLGGDRTRDLTVDAEDNVYAATNGGGVITYDLFYKWDDEEALWTQISNFPPELEAICLGTRDDGMLFTGTFRGMVRSGDGGETWLPADLWPRSVRTMAFGPDGTIYASTAYFGTEEIFRSTDDGASWISVSSGLNGLPVLSLIVGPEGRLYAGTLGGGVYRTTLSVTGVRDERDTPTAKEMDLSRLGDPVEEAREVIPSS